MVYGNLILESKNEEYFLNESLNIKKDLLNDPDAAKKYFSEKEKFKNCSSLASMLIMLIFFGVSTVTAGTPQMISFFIWLISSIYFLIVDNISLNEKRSLEGYKNKLNNIKEKTEKNISKNKNIIENKKLLDTTKKAIIITEKRISELNTIEKYGDKYKDVCNTINDIIDFFDQDISKVNKFIKFGKDPEKFIYIAKILKIPYDSIVKVINSIYEENDQYDNYSYNKYSIEGLGNNKDIIIINGHIYYNKKTKNLYDMSKDGSDKELSKNPSLSIPTELIVEADKQCGTYILTKCPEQIKKININY